MAGLATRCTGCGTVFRVVQDQLRVAGGYVRCGRCSEVFNASQSLVDLDTLARPAPAPVPEPSQPDQPPAIELQMPEQQLQDEAPPQHAPVELEPEPEAGTDFELKLGPEPEPEPEPEPIHYETAFDPALDLPPQPDALAEVPTEAPHDAAPTDTAAHDVLHVNLDPLPPQSLPDNEPDGGTPLHGGLVADDSSRVDWMGRPSTGHDADAAADVQPSFVRSADRAQRWRRPGVRAALAAGSVVAALLLVGQMAVAYRDLVVARFPAARDVLAPVCEALGCRIEAARSIESLTVESSGLVRVEKSAVYKLQVALRNHAAIAVAVPALDLTLSDSTGRLIARRVLRLAELGVNEATLAAGRELSLQATLQAATEPVAGYTVELFYP